MDCVLSSSFWLPIILQLTKPKTLQERAFITTHALLMDNEFIPLKCTVNSQGEHEGESSSVSNTNFQFPITEHEGGFSLEIVPSNWKCTIGKSAIYYFNKDLTLNKQTDEIKSASLKIETFTTEDSVILVINNIIAAQKCLTIGFPFSTEETYKDEETLMNYLAESIKENLINKLLSYKIGDQQHINLNIRNTGSSNLNANFHDHANSQEKGNLILLNKPVSYIEYEGFPSIDPLIDDKGVRGSLVGPDSSIFKRYPKLFGKPKYIPASSVPGGTITPDNDMFNPPGKRDLNIFY